MNKSIKKSNISNKLNEPINNNHTLVSCYTVVKRSKIDNVERSSGELVMHWPPVASHRPPATGHKRHCAFPAVASLTDLLLLSASFGCNARLSKSAGRKPASIGRLRVGCPETRVEWAFQPGVAGNARKQWASGQALRRSSFYAGFRADTVAVLWQVLSSVCGCRRRDSAGDTSPSLFSSCYLVSGALTGGLQRCVLL